MKPLTIATWLICLPLAVNAINCSNAKRLKIAKKIIGAFNDPNPVTSAATIESIPFDPLGTIEFCINGAPCVRVGYDSTTSKQAALAARQAVSHVKSKYYSFDNGTTVMDAEVTIGAGYVIDSPVKTAIYVPGMFDLGTCLILDLPAYFVFPNKVAGHNFTLPGFPPLPIQSIPP